MIMCFERGPIPGSEKTPRRVEAISDCQLGCCPSDSHESFSQSALFHYASHQVAFYRCGSDRERDFSSGSHCEEVIRATWEDHPFELP